MSVGRAAAEAAELAAKDASREAGVLANETGAAIESAARDVARAIDEAEGRVAATTPHRSSDALPGSHPATAPVTVHESYVPTPLKPGDVDADWSRFLGSGDWTNLHPRTGVPDPDRLVSADGLRSIRLGPHELGSSPTRFHYHREQWSYDATIRTWTVTNAVVRVPFPKGAW